MSDETKKNSRPSIVVKQIIVYQMMTPKELSQWLNLSVTSIRMMVSRSRRGRTPNPIPFFQIGGKSGQLRFDYDEIMKWARGPRQSP